MHLHLPLKATGRYLGLAFVAYSLFVLLIFLIQDKLIFFPTKIGREEWVRVAQSLDAESVEVATEDDVRLRGWFLPGQGTSSKPTIIFFGGNAMRLDRFAPILNPLREKGINIALIDYRGYGASDGKPNTDDFRNDSEVMYDHFMSYENVDSQRIFVWGVSLGTGIATHLASQRDIEGVILFAPFTSTTDVAKDAYPFLPVRMLLRHKLDNLSLASQLSVPVLIVHGDADRVNHISHSQKLAEVWEGETELVILQGRGHNDLFADEKIYELIREHVFQSSSAGSEGRFFD